MYQKTNIQNPDSAWKRLYKVGGVSALLAVLVFRRFFSAELIAFKGFGIFNVPEVAPVSAIDWFTLLQNETLVGLLLLDLFDLINYALVGLIFLALYGALRKVDKSSMVIATTFSFVGIAVYFASNHVFSMLALSHRHAEATTNAQRDMLLAAGEGLLAINNPNTIYKGTGFYVSFLLVLLAGLFISIIMLQSTKFNKATAYTGIAANLFALGYFIALAFAPSLSWLPPTLSAPFRLIWYILIAIKLFQLSANKQRE